MSGTPVGIVGCGAISDVYFEAGDVFESFDVVACGDLDTERAEEQAAEFDVPWSGDTEALFERDDVEIVLNLTPPHAHPQVITAALEAGKHVYTEKPLATTAEEGRELVALANEQDLLLGSAPDTVLGQGIQTARRLIEDGAIGDPISATAFWTSGGHESWHPRPEIFYRAGGGPLFDMGPYYVTALTQLLGPAERIAGGTQQPHAHRTITNDERDGEQIDVEVPTTEAGIVDFESGVTASLFFSFDVPHSEIGPQNSFEVHGTEGTIHCPDPNHFEGPVRIKTGDDDSWTEVPLLETTVPQQRGLGLHDMAQAVAGEWTQRATGAMGLHTLEVLEGVRSAAAEGAYVEPQVDLAQPDPASDWYETK